MLSLSLVIPVFNESSNLEPLARSLETVGLSEILWVNNGSTDDSATVLEKIAADKPLHHLLSLDKNQGYGGGVRRGILATRKESTHVGWIPADGQVSAGDLKEIWKKVATNPTRVHKGFRKWREDSFSQKVVSRIYSAMARRLLDLPVDDVNALPKIFPAPILRRAVAEAQSHFVFDAEVLWKARRAGVEIEEHPVRFHRRHRGKSSWSSSRIKTYWTVGWSLWELRKRA